MSRIGNFGEVDCVENHGEVGNDYESNYSPQEEGQKKLDTYNPDAVKMNEGYNVENPQNSDGSNEGTVSYPEMEHDNLTDNQREKLHNLEEGKNNYLDSNGNIMDKIINDDGLSRSDKIDRLKNLKADTENFGQEYDDAKNDILSDDAEDPTKKLVLRL